MFVLSPFAAYLLTKTMTLPEHAGVSAVEQMHWAWAALVTLTSFWWAHMCKRGRSRGGPISGRSGNDGEEPVYRCDKP
ncbi:hypothetical protein QFZ97_007717 [Paraburkholderia youngii]